MEITKKYIELCINAKAVQKARTPTKGDIYVHNETKKHFILKGLTDVKLIHPKYHSFIPRSDWFFEMTSDYMPSLLRKDNKWFIISNYNIPGVDTEFTHQEEEVCFILFCEFVLSNGKNDLRKLLKDN